MIEYNGYIYIYIRNMCTMIIYDFSFPCEEYSLSKLVISPYLG